MGLFDKKFCDICGAKIGLLGNKKLSDGNCCKECAAKLSPFFTERKQSTIEEIKAQLAYREANKQEVAAFNISQTYGTRTKIMIDEKQGKFMVTDARKLDEANPDVINISDITNCRVDVDQSRYELYGYNNEGKHAPYSPAQYGTRYDFYVIIEVNNPYFDEIKVKLNDNNIEIEPSITIAGHGGPGLLGAILGGPQNGPHDNNDPDRVKPIPVQSSSPVDPTTNAEYEQYRQMAGSVVGALTKMRQGVREEAAAASAPKTQVTCPNCGAQTLPDAAGCCEFCGAKIG